MRTRTETVIDVADWDKLVSETYSRPYSLQQQDGCQERGRLSLRVPNEPEDFENDSVPEVVNHAEMGVSFIAWQTRDPDKLLLGRGDEFGLGLWWARNFYPNLQMVANDLHSKGLLDAGDYSIDIDW